jgi:histidinol-phosphate aminotransferase
MATLKRELTDAVSALPSAVNPLALSLNENPFPPLPAVRSALIESIDAANRYPEFLPERLRSLIAGRVGVRDEQVVIGVGATGVILQVLLAVTSPGEKMVMTSPTFDGYPIFAQMARLESVTLALDAHGHHDLEAMADAAADARVVVVCRPHNPTGTVESAADIEHFLQRVPSDTVVVLDEAYVEFLPPEFRIDAPTLVARYPNVVVLRTFSKAYGLAGLRVGYLIGHEPVAQAVRKTMLPFTVNSLAQAAAVASLAAESELLERVEHVVKERDRVRRELLADGWTVPATEANFVWLPLGEWSAEFSDHCDAAGVSVRPYVPDGVRVTVGDPEANDAFLAAAAQYDRRV